MELLSTSSGAAQLSPAGRQPCVTEEQLPNERRGRVTILAPTMTVRTSTTTVGARRTTPVHGTTPTGTVRRGAGSGRRGSAAWRGWRWAVEQARRVNAPSVQVPDADEEPFRSAPLRCCCYLFRVTAFALCTSSFRRYSFSLLCPGLPPFHYTLGQLALLTVLLLFSFVSSRYYWLYCTAIIFLCVLFAFLVSEREFRFTFAIMSCRRSSVSLSVVCNVRAPYSGDWHFRQCFDVIWYLSHLLTSR